MLTPTETRAPEARPVRLQLSRKKGFDLQAHSRAVNGLPAVKVDRTTSWGNPYRAGDELAFGPYAGTTIRDVQHAVEIFEEWARYAIAGRARPQDGGGPAPTRAEVARSLDEIRGRNLACWCPPGSPCHADVLLRLANGPVCEALPANESQKEGAAV